MSAAVAVVAVTAVLVIVGFNVSDCILCVRDMYASLDNHMICCPQGRRECLVTGSLSKQEMTKSRQAFRAPWCMCVGKATCLLRPRISRRLWRSSPTWSVLSLSSQDECLVLKSPSNMILLLQFRATLRHFSNSEQN